MTQESPTDRVRWVGGPEKPLFAPSWGIPFPSSGPDTRSSGRGRREES